MRRLRTALLSFGFVLALSAARADTKPPARDVCANGLEVLVAENHATPLVTVELAVHEGAMTEDDAYSGLAHLYEHMFFKGNAVISDELAYMARARALGLLSNGTTGNERVNYYFTTTSDHLADTMAFARDAMVTTRFDPKELERERVVVTGEFDRTRRTWRATSKGSRLRFNLIDLELDSTP